MEWGGVGMGWGGFKSPKNPPYFGVGHIESSCSGLIESRIVNYPDQALNLLSQSISRGPAR